MVDEGRGWLETSKFSLVSLETDLAEKNVVVAVDEEMAKAFYS